MTSLELYQAVNQTKSLTDLIAVVKTIKGSPLFTDEQIDNFIEVLESLIESNGDLHHKYTYSRLTRTFGIRQQAIMLVTYKKY